MSGIDMKEGSMEVREFEHVSRVSPLLRMFLLASGFALLAMALDHRLQLNWIKSGGAFHRFFGCEYLTSMFCGGYFDEHLVYSIVGVLLIYFAILSYASRIRIGPDGLTLTRFRPWGRRVKRYAPAEVRDIRIVVHSDEDSDVFSLKLHLSDGDVFKTRYLKSRLEAETLRAEMRRALS